MFFPDRWVGRSSRWVGRVGGFRVDVVGDRSLGATDFLDLLLGLCFMAATAYRLQLTSLFVRSISSCLVSCEHHRHFRLSFVKGVCSS